jgi:hypothetical protein
MLGKCSITQQHPQLSVFLTFYIASRLFAFVEKKKKYFLETRSHYMAQDWPKLMRI